ncbi:hypothetical protein EJ06DRAFT_533067 [Trichodelitschia bisporula]|uniref:SPT2-domain-containing protein n=1 Tax=Trichodelitschia bisporula TaxID=703511 RepID=A0A6G1HN17_9PEZI|nr:hypothetical protein EJ06DRAFT_533067 [Trichodelitschia bisporula]
MSFLSSILASIDGKPANPAPPVVIRPAVARPVQKRKASDALVSESTKAVKRESGAGRNDTATSAAAPASSTPYRGTAGLKPTKQPTKPPEAKGDANAQARPTAPSTQSSSLTKTPTLPQEGKAPRKGSYMDLLRRANAHSAQKEVPIIKHKPSEKQPLKRRMTQQELDKKGATQDKKIGQKSRTSSAEPIKQPEQKRKPVESGYKGTMRPTAPAPVSYKGTMNLNKPAPRKPVPPARVRPTPKDNGPRYIYRSEQEEGDDYDSAASSDMEADPFELEREEEKALRAAKEEDKRALAEEAELKRQKAERKARLLKMQSDAQKKKRIF